jgi:hypothetical protein
MSKIKNRYKKLVWAVTLALVFSCTFGNGVADTRVSFSEIDAVPAIIKGVNPEACAYGRAELPPQDVVAAEVKHLEQNLPAVAALDISVYIVGQRCTLPGFGSLAGCMLPGNKSVYLFSSPRYAAGATPWTKNTASAEQFAKNLAAYTLAHEVGHVVRHLLVSEQTLQEYIQFRGLERISGSEWACDPEEIFAEDFRWLFGSAQARQIKYLCSCEPPGEKERNYLLKILAGVR